MDSTAVGTVAALWAAGAASAAAGIALWNASRDRRQKNISDRVDFVRNNYLVNFKEMGELVLTFEDAVKSSGNVDSAYIALAKQARLFDFMGSDLRAVCHDLLIAAGELHTSVINAMGPTVIAKRTAHFEATVERWNNAARRELGY